MAAPPTSWFGLLSNGPQVSWMEWLSNTRVSFSRTTFPIKHAQGAVHLRRCAIFPVSRIYRHRATQTTRLNGPPLNGAKGFAAICSLTVCDVWKCLRAFLAVPPPYVEPHASSLLPPSVKLQLCVQRCHCTNTHRPAVTRLTFCARHVQHPPQLDRAPLSGI